MHMCKICSCLLLNLCIKAPISSLCMHNAVGIIVRSWSDAAFSLQGENGSVNTFTKQQHLTDSVNSAFPVRKKMVYIKCTGAHE